MEKHAMVYIKLKVFCHYYYNFCILIYTVSDDSLSAGEITGMVIGILLGGTLFIMIAITIFCLWYVEPIFVNKIECPNNLLFILWKNILTK